MDPPPKAANNYADASAAAAAELMHLCYTPASPQGELNEALRQLNVAQFERALRRGADPNGIATAEGDGKLSVFEVCCQRPGRAEFVRLCVQNGGAVNKVNSHLDATPINLAAASADCAHLAALLWHAGVHIDRPYAGKTPLSALCTGLTDANCPDRVRAIELLLVHQANPNAVDERGLPPLLAALKTRKLGAAGRRRIAEVFLAQPSIDVDTHWAGQTRQLLADQFPDLPLPAQRDDEAVPDDADMLDALRSADEPRFVRLWNDRALRDEQGLMAFVAKCHLEPDAQPCLNPMRLAIENGLEVAVGKLLRRGAAVTLGDQTPDPRAFNAVRLACHYGQHKILDRLLSAAQSENRASLADTASRALLDTVPNIGRRVPMRNAHSIDYQRCVDQLLQISLDRGIDLARAGDDALGNTALHLAAIHRQRDVQLQLLKHGASLSVRNALGELALADMDADVLRQHFDASLQASADQRPGDERYALQLDLGCFRPPEQAGRTRGPEYSNNEMTPLAHMCRDREMRALIKHPLVAGLLWLKWQRLAPCFYANFVAFALFCAVLLAYVMGRNAGGGGGVPATGWSVAADGVLALCVACGCVYIAARELVLLLLAGFAHYLRRVSTYATWTLVALTVCLLVDGGATVAGGRREPLLAEQWRRSVSATLILLAAGEFFVLLGSLPILALSTHLMMLLTVARSFLRSLLLYSIMLAAFALCFFTLLGRDAAPAKHDEDAGDESGGGSDDFDEFRPFGLAVVKTLVMMTGEFDAGSIGLGQNVVKLLVFVVFVFLVSTVLFNLLNGLAVSDTQAIKADAELSNLVYRARLLARWEDMLRERGREKRWCTSLLNRIVSGRIAIFPDLLPLGKLRILPNRGNLVQIPVTAIAAIAAAEDKESAAIQVADDGVPVKDLQFFDGHWTRWLFGSHTTGMEPRIVKCIRGRLEEIQLDTDRMAAERERKRVVEERLAQIEQSMAEVVKRLDRVMETLNN